MSQTSSENAQGGDFWRKNLHHATSLQGKRLFYVVNYIDYFLSHRRHIALAAQAQGAQVFVLSPDQASAHRVTELGFEHKTIPLARWGLNPLQDIRTLVALRKLYREARPDIVHHITIKPVIYGGMAARLARVPVVVHSISGLGYVFYSRGFKSKLRRGLVKCLYKLALRNPRQCLIIQNEDNREYFLSSKLISSQDTKLILGAGVDTERFSFREEPSGSPIVLFVARLQWAKGIQEFAEVASEFQRRGSDARFVLAGGFDKGSPDGLTELDAERLAEEHPIRFLGERSDIEHLLAQSHIACLPSYSEGLPKSLVEAAAAGRPIVATDIAGCRAIVKQGYNGLLVPPRDVAQLTDALEQLLNDQSLRERMGANGRKFVEEFGLSEEKVAQSTLAVYESLLEKFAENTSA